MILWYYFYMCARFHCGYKDDTHTVADFTRNLTLAALPVQLRKWRDPTTISKMRRCRVGCFCSCKEEEGKRLMLIVKFSFGDFSSCQQFHFRIVIYGKTSSWHIRIIHLWHTIVTGGGPFLLYTHFVESPYPRRAGVPCTLLPSWDDMKRWVSGKLRDGIVFLGSPMWHCHFPYIFRPFIPSLYTPIYIYIIIQWYKSRELQLPRGVPKKCDIPQYWKGG